MKIGVNYNERSWAIDLVSHINEFLSSQNRSIKRAGGEHTISTDGGILYPDVLLFGDDSSGLILQGWELKMPDTKIDDREFFDNAKSKAEALGLDSFVLWNVSKARLYSKNNNDDYNCVKRWDDLTHITSRSSVKSNSDKWKKLSQEIIDYINDLFSTGKLEGRPFIEAYKSGGVTALIMNNRSIVRESLYNESARNPELRYEITLLENIYKSTNIISDQDIYSILAAENLSNWVGKFLFGHILQRKDDRARIVNQISGNMDPACALKIFNDLSEECNFWTIFSNGIGLDSIPETAWSHLLQFNNLLSDIRIDKIDQSQLSEVMEANVDEAVRKLRGQYATPSHLAHLLVNLCMDDIFSDRVLDPFCGSGSIPRAVLERKLNAKVEPEAAASRVVAGDLDPQAVQIATLAMAKPELMDVTLRIYIEDAFKIDDKYKIELNDPRTGKSFTEELGHFDAIVSNLPFVSQDGRKRYNDAILDVNATLANDDGPLHGRSDVSAYIPFALRKLLVDGGRLGIVITNAWLGTEWGEEFFRLIVRYFRLKYVIASGAGRWFDNSDVITNLLVMEKKDVGDPNGDIINFIVLKTPISEIDIDSTTALIRLEGHHDDALTVRSVSYDDIDRFQNYGLGRNAQFVNCDWILDLPLVLVSNFFRIRRGERRGWDSLFYPKGDHGIESTYIQPVVKSSSDIGGYITSACSDAFVCSADKKELKNRGHSGALAWISRFENETNSKGRPLPEVLARPNMHWYEMSADAIAHLVMPLNIGSRFFVSKLDPIAFVNQRLIRFNAYENTDIDICHALLNSAVCMFMIEGMGFGRGLGALDLNKDKIEKYFHILDPSQLDPTDRNRVVKSFKSLIGRDLKDLEDELGSDDRRDFDDTIIQAFGLSVTREEIYESLMTLFQIRKSVEM